MVWEETNGLRALTDGQPKANIALCDPVLVINQL